MEKLAITSQSRGGNELLCQHAGEPVHTSLRLVLGSVLSIIFSPF